MIDPQEMDDYMGGGDDPFAAGPKPKPNKATGPAVSADPFAKDQQPVKSTTSYAPLSNVDLSNSDIQKFLGPEGVNNPVNTGQDLNLMMGVRQSFGNKLGRRLVNLVPNVAADLLDMVGSMGSLLTEWGNERDYRNALNDAADALKNPAGENYKRSNDTWAISDPTWWIDNAFNTIEFAGAYALGGMGVAKGLGSVAKAIGTEANLGARGMKFLNEVAKLGTSATVSYAQGAMAGADVFKEVYDTQVTKLLAAGKSFSEAQEEAKHIASQSAASTAQIATLLTMAINYQAYGPAFRTQEQLAREIVAGRVASMEGQSAGTIAKMIRGLNAEDYADKLFHHQGVRQVLDEMIREGGEEVLQQFAQQTGSAMGNDGKVKGFLSQFGELENLTDRVANSEGLFAFTLGAAFGGLQHTLIHNVIPSKNVEALAPDGTPIMKMNGEEVVRDKRGNPVFQKHWVTPRKYEHDFTQRAFYNVQEAAAADFENFADLQNEFLAAHKAKDFVRADEIRDEMFNPGKLYAVRTGMSEPWKKTFQQIADMPIETAMRTGYSMAPDDTEYQERAKEAVKDIDHLTKEYEKLQKRYGTRYEENQGLIPLIDMVFARTADIYSSEKRIGKYEQQLIADEKEEAELANIANRNLFDQAASDFVQKHNSAKEVTRQLDQDLMTLESILQSPSQETAKQAVRILKKYRAIGFGTEDMGLPIKDLLRKLKAKREQVNAAVIAAESTLLNTTDYNEWIKKHPDKSFDEYMQEANKRYNMSQQNRFRRAQLDEAKVQLDIAKENLADMTNDQNATKFMRKMTDWAKSLEKEAQGIQEASTAKLAEMTKDKATLLRLEKIERNNIAEKYRNDRNIVNEQINQNEQRLQRLKRELETIHRDPMRASALRRMIRLIEKEQEQLIDRARVLHSLYRSNLQDTAPSSKPIVREQVTGDENGKVTVSTDEAPTTGTTRFEMEEAAEMEQGAPVTGTIEEMAAEIEAASAKYATMEDEINAMRKRLAEEDEADTAEEVYDNFAELINKAHPKVREKINDLIDGMLAGTVGFSLDYLNQEINENKITQPFAHKILIAARDHVTVTKQLLDNPTTPEPPVTTNPPEGKPEIIVTPPAEPDTPAIETDPAVAGAVPESSDYHAGYKIVNAATTGATSTIGYEEGTRKNKDGSIAYIKVTKPTELLRPANEAILSPKGLPAGHPLIYEVDWNYDGPKLITDQLSWDGEGNPTQGTEKGTDYLDGKGKVMTDAYSIGNVPIRVLDGVTGEFLFHIRKMDWINAKYPNTRDYRNVAEATKEDPKNIETQRRILLEMRTAIVNKFNADGTATEGKSEGKGTGRLILNHVVQSKDKDTLAINSKVIPKLAYNKGKPEESMLPQHDLEIVIVGTDGYPKSGKDFSTTKTLGFDPSYLVKGGVGALVQAPNGKYMYAPLLGMKLVEPGKPSPALASVVRAIELYILNDGTDPTIRREIDELQRNTNFDVGTARGLKAFINQYYTYSQDFQDSALSPNARTGEKTERFVFSINDVGIADKTKQIKVGFTMRGDGVTYANVVNGALAESFVAKLTEGFSQRSRAVVYTDPTLGIKGINSSGSFYDAVYVPGKGWKHNQYNSYNEYVKSFSKTPVYGRNTIGEGKNQQYVYTANPHLNISLGRDVKPTKENKSIKQPKTPPKPFESDAAMFDDLANFAYAVRNKMEVDAFGTGSEKSQPLTFENLEKMYNFTPENQRNGRTVHEVMDDLNGRGHTYISDGYNPFSRCL